MKTRFITALVTAGLAAALATGCSSSSPTTKDPVPGAGSSGTSGAPADTAPPADTTTPPAAVVKAPTIDGVSKMTGSLHVTWTNAEPAADTVELERKTATVAYKVVYSLPGEADNKHDMGASDATMYTYRARCKKGTTYSAYSNEMSGSPK